MGKGDWYNYLLASGFAFLSLFMIKSLFIFNKRVKDPMRKYLNAKDEPVLFDYLYKLADEAGAPRPHKVFLSDRVNASVSYDLSILNLLFPSKKNLEIGLGIVNVLSLGELKAVLAHEFGHFAQRSMLLGRYVYVAQQIAAQIVSKRDILDKFLSGLSGIDLRIAWIGWILSILVWAIRSLIETCFSVVAIAERALSREMEFQADLVAVSLTGSDALMHALYKLQIADQAYDNAVEVINSELNNKKAIYNLYSLQSNYIDKMSLILRDPYYGKSPEISKEEPALNRIFASRTYNPPKMWSTHPADRDREENAKRNYIAADIDNRTSEDLLSNPHQFEVEMTASLISTAKVETSSLTDKESIEIQNKKYFNWSFLDPKYNSAYLNRYPFVSYEKVGYIYDHSIDSNTLKEQFNSIYPKTLGLEINQLKEINEEIDALMISENEVVTAEKRIITHRGEQIKRKDIPEIIASLKVEEASLRNQLIKHDKICRQVHYEAALKLGNGWPNYLKDLAALVHYSEHAITNLEDCSGKFHNVLNVALADGHVSSSELLQILDISNEYYYAVRKIYNNSGNIKLDKTLLEKLNLKSYADAYEEFTLTAPEKENINDWVTVIEGWASGATQILSKLRNVSLEQLLDTESYLKEAFLNNDDLKKIAPKEIALLDKYDLLLPGNERSIERKLSFWNRFFSGDGLLPTVTRFGISGAIIFGALFLGNYSQKSTLHLYNGLEIPVNIAFDDEIIKLKPNSHKSYPINYSHDYNIVTSNNQGEIIEELISNFDDPSKEYIYNIANAAAFIEYPVFYGYEGTYENTNLGAKKWISTSADYIFEEPPTSISLSSSSSGERKDAVVAYSNIAPDNLITIVENEQELEKIISSHVKWDPPISNNLMAWVGLLNNVDNKIELINNRLKKNPDEVISLRALLDQTDSIQRISVCKDYIKKASDQPENSDLYYLSCRCIENELEKDKAFIKGHKKWENNSWLAFAAAYSYAEMEEWKASFDAYTISAKNNAQLGELIALDAERVRRIVSYKTGLKDYDNPIIDTEDVKFYSSLERGELEEQELNPNNAYYLMSQGKIEESFAFVENYEEYKPYVLRLLGASNGASKDIINAALNLSNDQGINYNTIWSALGLAVKQNIDDTAYINSISEMGIESKLVKEFLNNINQSKFVEAEKIISDQDFRLKAQFYTLAKIIAGNKTPKEWNNIIKYGLFVNERPYL